ncbi:lipase family protein [Streptomyces sviceus]|uniref:lipase family protein n=1 Tax=Streptomyces sviceus TaxID=285530 RepID=UPI0036EBC55A
MTGAAASGATLRAGEIAGRDVPSRQGASCSASAHPGTAQATVTADTRLGGVVADIIAAEPAAQAVLDEQRIGTLKPAGPVRVATGVQDDIVPHAQARQLAVDWCRKGGNVTYAAVDLPDLGDRILTNHLAPLIADQGTAISWLTDRLEGEPTTSNCWTMPFQR